MFQSFVIPQYRAMELGNWELFPIPQFNSQKFPRISLSHDTSTAVSALDKTMETEELVVDTHIILLLFINMELIPNNSIILYFQMGIESN